MDLLLQIYCYVLKLCKIFLEVLQVPPVANDPCKESSHLYTTIYFL